ncbi:MAG: hypothetical protein PVH59_00805 [Anaerolineae bacterium]|jgi:hypothetical protein
MGVTCSQQLAGFCRGMVLLVCVQAEVSLTVLSEPKGVADCVHQTCFCREEKYYPYEAPQDLAYRIRVKENAPEVLRRARITGQAP